MTCRRAVQLASYRCLRCNHDWRERPSFKVECPNCGELYVKWTNYDHDFGSGSPKPERAPVAAGRSDPAASAESSPADAAPSQSPARAA